MRAGSPAESLRILSDRRLEVAARILAGESFRETKLKRLLSGMEGFDYVLLDCAPGMTLLTQNALMLAEEVIVPVSMEFLSLWGVKELENQLAEVRELAGHAVLLRFVIPTFVDRSRKKTAEVLEALAVRFPDKMAAGIRINTKISEAAAAGQTVFEYAPGSPGAEDYAALVEEVEACG